jgi:hypothetical protein
MIVFFSMKKNLHLYETLRTKTEPVHFGSGIETQFFFSGKKKVNHYENESTVKYGHDWMINWKSGKQYLILYGEKTGVFIAKVWATDEGGSGEVIVIVT